MALALSPEDRAAVADFRDHAGLSASGAPTERLALAYFAYRALIYENLSKILRLEQYPDPVPARLETPSILLPPHLERGTGGTCYSLAYSFAALLELLEIPAYLTLNDLNKQPQNHAAVVALVGDTAWLCDPGVQFSEPIAFSPDRIRAGDNGWSRVQIVPPTGGSRYSVMMEMDGVEWEGFVLDARPVPEEEFRIVWQRSFGGPLMNTFHVFRHCGDHTRHLCFGRRKDQCPGVGRRDEPIAEAEALDHVRDIWPGIPGGHAEAALAALKTRGYSPVWSMPTD